MLFYKHIPPNKNMCLLCKHYCKLSIGQTGICGVNKNTDQGIECLVHSHPCALNIDPIEKKPLYHFLPGSSSLSLGTIGCNFHCSFCQNWGISQEKNINTSQTYTPKKIVQIALKNKCQSISYTYNEPTIWYPYAKDIALEAKKYGIKNIFVSNGFESSEMIQDMKGIIDAVNIDLKCFTQAYYKKLGGTLQGVLDTIVQMHSNGIWIEITTLIIPGKNDSPQELTKIAQFIKNIDNNIPWHISAFHPDYKEQSILPTGTQSLLLAKKIGKKVGLNHVYIGNAGFDNPTFCPSCGLKVIQRHDFQTTSNKIINTKCPRCQTQQKGVFMSTREAAVAGKFYPSSADEIHRYINAFHNISKDSPNSKSFDFTPKAIISPHAGYIFSGFTANCAYEFIPKDTQRVIVIGPSHRVYLQGASISLHEKYSTPLGDLFNDKPYAQILQKQFDFLEFHEKAHKEHSTETQFPFIKNYLPHAQVIEVVYGKTPYQNITQLIQEVLSDPHNFVVISTDLSHFYPLEKAKQKDNICLHGIQDLDVSLLNSGCEACGILGVKALVEYANKHCFESALLDYRTSYDRTNDNSSVVGYVSAVIG